MTFQYFTHRGFECKALKKNFPVKHVSVRNLVDKSQANDFIQDLIMEKLSNTKYTLVENNATAMTDAVVINCKEHGSYRSSATKVRSGIFCKGCQLEGLWDNSRSGTKKFVEKAVGIHGDLYDYSKVVYVNSHTVVDIICKRHGSFQQTPTHHIHGKKSGCPVCGQEKRTQSIRKFARKVGYSGNVKDHYIKVCPDGTNLYIMKFSNQNEVFYKVGISKNIPVRLYNLRHHSPYQVELNYSKWYENAEDAYDIEQKILDSFVRYSPQVHFSGASECTLDIADIKKHLKD